MLRSLIVLALALSLVPVFVIATLRFVPPPVTAYMLQSEVRPVYYQWVPADRIAEPAGKAVVASEDQKFWTHSGFDFDAIEEAYELNKSRSHKRGASTISQQTAKNLFLWPGGGYFRKGIEAWFTMLIEAMWPKARILEIYLNIVEFGPGIYGVEAAAQRFFGKPAAQLSADEAARLAAALPRPLHWHAASGSDYAAQRSRWILGQMGYRGRVPAPIEPRFAEDEVLPEDEMPAAIPMERSPPGLLGAPAVEAPDAAESPLEPVDGLRTYPLAGGEVVDEPVGDAAEDEAEDEEEEAEEEEE